MTVSIDLAGTCTIPGCTKPLTRRKYLCGMHYHRIYRNGTIDRLPKAKSHFDKAGYIVDNNVDHPLTSSTSLRQHRRVLYDAIGPEEHPCHWCGGLVSWNKTYPTDPNGLVVDHLDDNKQNNDPANLVPSCGACNIHRGVGKIKITQRARFARYTYNGETLCSSEWAERVGISHTAFEWRLSHGWSMVRAVTTPRGVTGPTSMKGAR